MIDVGICKTASTNCNKGNTSNNIISNCSYLQRIAVGLKYYEMLRNDKKNNQTKVTKQLLAQFCMETYLQFLDDYIHFIKIHGDNKQLSQIAYELRNTFGFATCDISKCKKLDRHHRSNTQKHKNIKDDYDNKFEFYSDCFDRCHHQFFHLFQMGLRIKFDEIN
eukprot:460741_1